MSFLGNSISPMVSRKRKNSYTDYRINTKLRSGGWQLYRKTTLYEFIDRWTKVAKTTRKPLSFFYVTWLLNIVESKCSQKAALTATWHSETRQLENVGEISAMSNVFTWGRRIYYNIVSALWQVYARVCVFVCLRVIVWCSRAVVCDCFYMISPLKT